MQWSMQDVVTVDVNVRPTLVVATCYLNLRRLFYRICEVALSEMVSASSHDVSSRGTYDVTFTIHLRASRQGKQSHCIANNNKTVAHLDIRLSSIRNESCW